MSHLFNIKIKVGITLIGLYLIIIFNSCGKNGSGCASTTYNFQTGVKAYPDRDSIHVGDTIWFESNIPTSLNDISTKQLIDYSGAGNLGTVISLDKFTGGSISDPGTKSAANEFNYVLLKGIDVQNNILPDRIKEYLFSEVGNQYFFKIGIIPKKVGTYIFGIDNPKNVYRNSNKCTKATYFINFENTNQHLYLYQKNRPGYTIEGLELTNAYCFKVY